MLTLLRCKTIIYILCLALITAQGNALAATPQDVERADRLSQQLLGLALLLTIVGVAMSLSPKTTPTSSLVGTIAPNNSDGWRVEPYLMLQQDTTGEMELDRAAVVGGFKVRF